MSEASLLISQMMVDECMSLREAMENAAAVTSQKLIAEEQVNEVEASENLLKKKV